MNPANQAEKELLAQVKDWIPQAAEQDTSRDFRRRMSSAQEVNHEIWHTLELMQDHVVAESLVQPGSPSRLYRGQDSAPLESTGLTFQE